MDTFPYQHHPSMLEAYLPNLSKQTTSSLETDMGSSSHSFYPSNRLHGSASAGNHLSYSASCNTQVHNKNGTDRKRKNRGQSCSDPAPTKVRFSLFGWFQVMGPPYSVPEHIYHHCCDHIDRIQMILNGRSRRNPTLASETYERSSSRIRIRKQDPNSLQAGIFT